MSWNLPPDARLDELARDWIDELVATGQIDGDDTADLYRLHWATHLIPFFGSAVSITEQSISAYCRARLKKVKRATLQKERSTLNGFLAWCLERRYLDSALNLPPLPKRAAGTAWHQPRRGAATDLTPEECAMLLAALPAWSTPRGGRNAFPIRARFIVAYETSLRPATLDALSVPEHWSRGRNTLTITDAIDKARLGREVPLTPTAQAALESVGKRGLIFGEHDYRHQLEKAAKQVLPAAKAKTFCAYDFRHARLTEIAEKSLLAAQYMGGHKKVTTTAIYVRPSLRAAQRTLAEMDPPSIEVLAPARAWRFESSPSHSQRHHSRKGSPASRNGLLTEGAPADALAGASLALLEAAASGAPVSDSDLRDFAVAALLLPDFCASHARLVHGVLTGGPHAPRRALELAQLIASESAAGAARREGGS